MLDIFALRNQIIDDYHRYIDSFLNIRDRKVKAFVDEELAKGELWQDPLIQLNYSQGWSATISRNYPITDRAMHQSSPRDVSLG